MEHPKETVGTAETKFQEYRRSAIAEMRPYKEGEDLTGVSISDADKGNGSPKVGDMVARNPKNHQDVWLVASQYFKDNFLTMEGKTKGLSFGKAIEALKQGKRVSRSGWNGKGMFIFMQVPSRVSGNIIPKMTSLPQSVKDEFKKRLDEVWGDEEKADFGITYQNQIAMVYPDNNIYGWVASPSDVLEEDWCILD